MEGEKGKKRGGFTNRKESPSKSIKVRVVSDTASNDLPPAPASNGASKVNECYAFKKGNCERGAACRFAHIASNVGGGDVKPTAPVSKAVNECFAFKKGNCERGAACRFAHVSTNDFDMQVVNEIKEPLQKLGVAVPPPPPPSTTSTSGDKASYITTVRFSDMPTICPESKRSLAEVMKYEYMTKVQVASLPEILTGRDCLVKAKTGTGKTLSFLIGSIEHIKKSGGLRGSTGGNQITSLIISPTRELASQIAAEAKSLLTYHPGARVEFITGGTNINTDKKHLEGAITFLVATPGRLLDLLNNHPGFSTRIGGIKVLIFDEADQLLDMGFKPDIDRILAFVPSKDKRLTLCFSATVPEMTKTLATGAMNKGYSYVDTVGEDTEQTHMHVHQELIVCPEASFITALYTLLKKQMSVPEYKIIVFFSTARVCGFMSDFFNSTGMKVLEIHSRMSQSARTRTSDLFRDGSKLILFSSDVSARGMDYANVTHVIQCGLTDREQYIHRLGRTARAGKEGSGTLLLYTYERTAMLKDLKDIRLTEVALDSINIGQYAPVVNSCISKVGDNRDLLTGANQAYQAHMGFYNSNLRKLNINKAELVQMSNQFAVTIGCREQPKLLAKTVGKMGLKGTPGLLIDRETQVNGGGGRGGGGGKKG